MDAIGFNPRIGTNHRACPLASRILALAAGAGLLLWLALPSAAAPMAGPNVSVMSGTKFPEGDPFLTKQNEPSIAVSSRNPQNLLAASNDYRAAELSIIEGLGGGKAWISLYKSVNGGTTWQPMLLAGCPLGNEQCNGGNAAIKGLDFSADPTLRAGPYGTFFLSFIAGRRDTSAGGVTAVQRFFDRNNALRRGDDPFVPDVLNILDTGTEGQFKDKPWVVADVPGRSWLAGKTCDLRPNYGSAPVPAFNVYVSFSNFVGQSEANPHPQLFVSASDDCGKTFGKPVKISNSVDVNSGSSLAVDPATGHVYAVWRRFGDAAAGIPDAIYLSKSTNGGKQFSNPIPVTNIKAFDQATTAGSFRSNGFPSLAVSVDSAGTSRIHVAWSERKAALDPATLACLAPDGNCDARVTLITSGDGGDTFGAPTRVDDWVSDPINPANPGRGHQIQPALTFAAGKLAITWVDQRYTQTVGELRCQNTDGVAGCNYPDEYREVRVPAGNLAACAVPTSPACATARTLVFRPFIDDAGLTRRHSVDAFAATAPVTTAGVGAFSSNRVSEYRYAQFDAATGKNCTPSSPTCVIRQTRFNFPNLPMFVNGTRPFIGDYIDIAAQAIVPSGGTYKFNTGINTATQAGGFKPTFHAVWADDRDVVPPKPKADRTVDWTNYQPLFSLDAITGAVSRNALACAPDGRNTGQSGNRDQNVYAAVVGEGWTAFANATTKNLTLNGATTPRGFVITVRNLELATTGRYELTATAGTGAQASFTYPGAGAATSSITVDVARRSSSTRTLWVTSTNPTASVSVLVRNLASPSDTTTVVLNADPQETPLGSADGGADVANNNLWYPNTGPGAEGLANVELANVELANNELANIELANIELANVELANAELANVELANIELANAELANVELANIELANIELANIELANIELANVELANAELANIELANVELANGPVIESTVIVKNSGNTDTTLAVKLLLRNLPAGAKTQLVVRKIALATVVGTACVPSLVERNAQVASIPQPRIFTPENIDTSFPDVRTETDAATLPLSVDELAQVTLRIVGSGLTSAQALEFGKWGTKFVVVDAKPSTVTTVPLVIKTFVLPAVQANAPAPVTIPGAPNGLQAIGGVPGSGLAWTIESVTPQPGFPALPPGTVTVDSASGALTVTNAPPGKYDLIVNVRDCAAAACTVPRQQDVQKLTLNVVNITFGAPLPPAIAVGSSVILPPATSGSGDPVSYTAPTDPALAPQPNDCTITGAGNPVVYTLTAGSVPGVCTVIAWAGGATLQLSVTVTASIAVKSEQTISFPAIAAQTYGPGATFAIGATATSGLPVSFASTTAGVCTVSAGTVTIVSTGNCTIVASQAGNGTYLAAPQVQQTVPINPAPQAIAFPAVAAQTYSPGATVGISATALSGATPTNLLVTFAASGSCTVSASSLSAGASIATVTLTGAGTCTLTANQAGNSFYSAASAAIQGFSIDRASQTIAFLALPDVTMPAAAFAVSATASSGLAVSFSSLSLGVCTVSGATVTLVAAGTCTIAADQAGNANYGPAPQVVRSFAVRPSWIATGAMLQPRSHHTATLLNDGKVLVAGGFDASGASTATSELYDPATGAFSPAGNLPSKSAGHTATLLGCACASDGKVLAMGGGNSSAEIFDPAARTWTATGGIGGNRSYHTATVLRSKKVLIVGGSDNASKVIATTLIFDPVTGGFSNGPALAVARESHVAILLDDGRVLVAGGRAKAGKGYTVIASAEIYDPVTGRFTAAGNMTAGRHSANAVLLGDGRVLVAGGSGDSSGTPVSALNTAELYTPTPGLAGTWAPAAQTPILATARMDFTLNLLPGGRSLAAGGRNAGGPLAFAEFHAAATGAVGAFSAAPSMLTARSGHTATVLPDGRVLVIGGIGAAGMSIGAAELLGAGP